MEKYYIFAHTMSGKEKAFVVAVDGYSSTGKSTVAKIVAAELGFTYIDTGAMYRAVTLAALERGWIVDGKVCREALREHLPEIEIGFRYNRELQRYETYLNGKYVEKKIREMEVSNYVSPIAAVDFVRSFLVEQQREMGRNGRIIMDGRDIGSVVFPDADIKFFLTSSPQVRAERRYKELIEKGTQVSYEEVEANVRQRDYIDEHREASPLVRTPDAILIDNSRMTIDDEVRFMVEKIKEKLNAA